MITVKYQSRRLDFIVAQDFNPANMNDRKTLKSRRLGIIIFLKIPRVNNVVFKVEDCAICILIYKAVPTELRT